MRQSRFRVGEQVTSSANRTDYSRRSCRDDGTGFHPGPWPGAADPPSLVVREVMGQRISSDEGAITLQNRTCQLGLDAP
jgi:hypothetical protein